MKLKRITAISFCVLIAPGWTPAAFGQGAVPGEAHASSGWNWRPDGHPPQLAGPGLQQAADAREAAVLAMCKEPAPAVPPAPAAGGPPQPQGPLTYTVQAIPGVIAAGQRWKKIWQTTGNNADGLIAQRDGSILIAQNDNSDVVKLDINGHASIVYRDTNTGGDLAQNTKGMLVITERSLVPAIWELSPETKLIADAYNGETFDCLRGILSSPAVLSNGGVYFREGGGLYYVNPQGVVTHYGQGINPNDSFLSRDEKTLYVPSRGQIFAFDVQPDGSLSNQRILVAEIPGGGNDGGVIDQQGRLYVGGYHGVRVFTRDGQYLGTIPAPDNITSVTFAGPDGKTLVATVERRNTDPRIAGPIAGVEVMTIPMIAQGYLD